MSNPTRIPEADLLPNGTFKPVSPGDTVYTRTDNRPCTVIGPDKSIRGDYYSLEFKEGINKTSLTVTRRRSFERQDFSLEPFEWLPAFGTPPAPVEIDLDSLYRRPAATV